MFKPKKKKTSAEAVLHRTRKSEKTGKLLAGGAVFLKLIIPVLLGGCACYYIVTAGFLGIRTIGTSGCDRIDCEKIAARAGIVPGRNIFFADVGRTTQLLEEDPLIYRAIVKRMLPGTIEIRVEERRAAAVLEMDSSCLVDRHAAVYYCTDQYDRDLPVITGLTREYVLANDDRAAELLDSALQLISGLEQHHMVRPEGATRILVEPSVGLTIDDDGLQIFMGCDGFEEKLELLVAVQKDLQQKGLTAQSINLGSSSQAAVSLSRPEPDGEQVQGGKTG